MLSTKPMDNAPRTPSKMPEVSINSRVPSNRTWWPDVGGKTVDFMGIETVKMVVFNGFNKVLIVI